MYPLVGANITNTKDNVGGDLTPGYIVWLAGPGYPIFGIDIIYQDNLLDYSLS